MMNRHSLLGIVGAGRRRCGGGENTVGGRVGWVGLGEDITRERSTASVL